VLDQACRQMSLWRKEKLQLPVIAVNLSLFQLKSGQELVRDVTQTIAKWGLAPSDLELDVTEATLGSSHGRKTLYRQALDSAFKQSGRALRANH